MRPDQPPDEQAKDARTADVKAKVQDQLRVREGGCRIRGVLERFPWHARPTDRRRPLSSDARTRVLMDTLVSDPDVQDPPD